MFFAAGCLEVVSILFRPISLSFRLYGNIFAGETMLETMARMPRIGWLVQVPFYLLELLVGLVQALVFMLLTAVFTLLICQQHDEGSAPGTIGNGATIAVGSDTGRTRKDHDRQPAHRSRGVWRRHRRSALSA